MADENKEEIEFSENYPLCHGVGLTLGLLAASPPADFEAPPDCLTNGLVLELAGVKADSNWTWPTIIKWMAVLGGEANADINGKASVMKVTRLKDTIAKLRKDKDKIAT